MKLDIIGMMYMHMGCIIVFVPLCCVLVCPVGRRQLVNVSFGIPGAVDVTVSRDASVATPLTFLALPTPGAVNSAPLPVGPFIFKYVDIASH